MNNPIGNILQKPSESIKLTITNHPSPIFIYQVETGNIRYVNRAGVTIYGYSREDFVDMSLSELFHTDFPISELRKAFTSKNGFYELANLIYKDEDNNNFRGSLLTLPVNKDWMLAKISEIQQ